jgi:hypothetical protein
MAQQARVLPVGGAMVLDVWDPARPADWYPIFVAGGARVYTIARGTIEAVEHEAGRVLLVTNDGYSVWYAGLDPSSIQTVRGARVEAGIAIACVRPGTPRSRPQLGLLIADAVPVSPYRFLVGARDPLETAAHRDPAALDGVVVA